MRVPVEVRFSADDGTAIEESTHTGVVGTTGAMIRMSHPLQVHAEVVVTNRFSDQSAKFRVVWLGIRQTDGLWEIGMEAVHPLDGFWGVRFSSPPHRK
jgi:hypothetical protein